MKRILIITSVLTLGCFICLFQPVSSATGSTLYVDGDSGNDANDGSVGAPFATIQAAIDAAAVDGIADEIIIAPANYAENLDIEHGDPIALCGDGDGVIIYGGGDDVIRITNSNVAIRNLVVVKGGNGIDAENSSLKLVHVDVKDGAGSGVEADDMTSVTVIGGTFADNRLDGITVDNAVEVRIAGASIKHVKNGIVLEGSDVIEIRNVDVSSCDDDGIEIDDSDTVAIINSRVLGSSESGDGIDIGNSRSISIVNLVSTDNGGNGLQIEAGIGKHPIEHVSVVRGVFDKNDKNGVRIVEQSVDGERGQINEVTLTSIEAIRNDESGLYIDFSGDLTLKSVRSCSNVELDNLP
jgi:hypothetical protein